MRTLAPLLLSSGGRWLQLVCCLRGQPPLWGHPLEAAPCRSLVQAMDKGSRPEQCPQTQRGPTPALHWRRPKKVMVSAMRVTSAAAWPRVGVQKVVMVPARPLLLLSVARCRSSCVRCQHIGHPQTWQPPALTLLAHKWLAHGWSHRGTRPHRQRRSRRPRRQWRRGLLSATVRLQRRKSQLEQAQALRFPLEPPQPAPHSRLQG